MQLHFTEQLTLFPTYTQLRSMYLLEKVFSYYSDLSKLNNQILRCLSDKTGALAILWD